MKKGARDRIPQRDYWIIHTCKPYLTIRAGRQEGLGALLQQKKKEISSLIHDNGKHKSFKHLLLIIFYTTYSESVIDVSIRSKQCNIAFQQENNSLWKQFTYFITIKHAYLQYLASHDCSHNHFHSKHLCTMVCISTYIYPQEQLYTDI